MFFDDYKDAFAAIENLTAWVDQAAKDGSFNDEQGQKLADALYRKADVFAGACAFAADVEYM